jgi:serine/threonine-protein kinase 11
LFGDGTVKLGDLGIGHSFDSADTVLGTPAYQAPEFFEEGEDIVLDPVREDIWSLGVSIFEAVFGRLPFEGGNVFEIGWSILNTRLEIPESASPALRDLLRRMLERDPAKRISLEEVRVHRFFEGEGMAGPLSVAENPVPRIRKGESTVQIAALVCGELGPFPAAQRSASSPLALYAY